MKRDYCKNEEDYLFHKSARNHNLRFILRVTPPFPHANLIIVFTDDFSDDVKRFHSFKTLSNACQVINAQLCLAFSLWTPCNDKLSPKSILSATFP